MYAHAHSLGRASNKIDLRISGPAFNGFCGLRSFLDGGIPGIHKSSWRRVRDSNPQQLRRPRSSLNERVLGAQDQDRTGCPIFAPPLSPPLAEPSKSQCRRSTCAWIIESRDPELTGCLTTSKDHRLSYDGRSNEQVLTMTGSGSATAVGRQAGRERVVHNAGR
jgi:hypothetical protein